MFYAHTMNYMGIPAGVVSANYNDGLPVGVQIISTRFREDIILNACETEKIQWLYENQLVKSSELSDDNIKLELIWDGDEQQRFKENFVEPVS